MIDKKLVERMNSKLKFYPSYVKVMYRSKYRDRNQGLKYKCHVKGHANYDIRIGFDSVHSVYLECIDNNLNSLVDSKIKLVSNGIVNIKTECDTEYIMLNIYIKRGRKGWSSFKIHKIDVERDCDSCSDSSHHNSDVSKKSSDSQKSLDIMDLITNKMDQHSNDIQCLIDNKLNSGENHLKGVILEKIKKNNCVIKDMIEKERDEIDCMVMCKIDEYVCKIQLLNDKIVEMMENKKKFEEMINCKIMEIMNNGDNLESALCNKIMDNTYQITNITENYVKKEEINLLIDNITNITVLNNDNLRNMLIEYIDSRLSINGGCPSNSERKLYKLGKFYYLFDVEGEFDHCNKIIYPVINQRDPNLVKILNPHFDIPVINSFFSEEVINTAYDCDNFYGYIINNEFYERGKRLLEITSEACVSITIMRDAAAFDNSIGYYLMELNEDRVEDVDNVKKIVILPTVKGFVNHQICLGSFKNKRIGFFLVMNGNDVSGENTLVNPNNKIFLTNFEVNDVEHAVIGDKHRHVFIREEKVVRKNEKNYLLYFEDLDKDMDKVINFNNVQLHIKINQKDGLENTARLV